MCQGAGGGGLGVLRCAELRMHVCHEGNGEGEERRGEEGEEKGGEEADWREVCMCVLSKHRLRFNPDGSC